jgi:hypothetical protein
MYTLNEEIYGRTRGGDSKSSHASIAREKERAHPPAPLGKIIFAVCALNHSSLKISTSNASRFEKL